MSRSPRPDVRAVRSRRARATAGLFQSASSPPGTTPTRWSSTASLHRSSTARRIARAPAACNSVRNADVPIASQRLVRITHPFHPHSGRQLVCVAERYNRYGKRLLLQVQDKTICSVPPEWTDLATVDPEIVLGGSRGLFRVTDLLELDQLVARLRKGTRRDEAGGV